MALNHAAKIPYSEATVLFSCQRTRRRNWILYGVYGYAELPSHAIHPPDTALRSAYRASVTFRLLEDTYTTVSFRCQALDSFGSSRAGDHPFDSILITEPSAIVKHSVCVPSVSFRPPHSIGTIIRISPLGINYTKVEITFDSLPRRDNSEPARA